MKPIGQIIKEELQRQERGISWFARKLSCDRSNVYRVFDKESIDTGMLLRISVVLQHDFFAEYSNALRERISSNQQESSNNLIINEETGEEN